MHRGVPDTPDGYSVTGRKDGSKHFVTHFTGRPKTEIRDTNTYRPFMPGVFARIRGRFGPELKILHDVHHRLRPREMAAQAHLNARTLIPTSRNQSATAMSGPVTRSSGCATERCGTIERPSNPDAP